MVHWVKWSILNFWLLLPAQELAEELLDFCRANLSHVKCPRSVDFDPELPRTPTGKLFKRLLRDRYWKGRQSRIL